MRPELFYFQLANWELTATYIFWKREEFQTFTKPVRNAGMYLDSYFAMPSLSFQDASEGNELFSDA